MAHVRTPHWLHTRAGLCNTTALQQLVHNRDTRHAPWVNLSRPPSLASMAARMDLNTCQRYCRAMAEGGRPITERWRGGSGTAVHTQFGLCSLRSYAAPVAIHGDNRHTRHLSKQHPSAVHTALSNHRTLTHSAASTHTP